MDGVTILSEMSVRGVELWRAIGVTLVSIIGIIAIALNLVGEWKYLGLFGKFTTTVLYLLFIMFIMLFPSAMIIGYNTFHTEYKVTIDDSVGFNEFTERYEVLSNNGDVYTVIERE